MLNPHSLRSRALAGLGVACRACLGPLPEASAWGLCEACWAGLRPLPELRCPRCALAHPAETACPEAVAWERGDALWDYHGGRPPLGALLVPGIKAGENGWRRALLRRAREAPWPAWVHEAELIVPAPTAPWKRWTRGPDLAQDWARLLAAGLGVEAGNLLRKAWFHPAQAGQTESARRRLPRKALRLRDPGPVAGRRVLVVDDVWTTGTTLLRCAQALREGGAAEVAVFTLFRALR